MRWGRRILGWVWVASVAASTLLFVAAVGMWGRSYWRDDSIRHAANSGTELMVFSTSGRVGAFQLEPFGSIDDLQIRYEIARNSRGLFRKGIVDSFEMHYTDQTGWHGEIVPFGYWMVIVPHWFIALLSLPLPLIAIWRWRKKRRVAREGLCKVCGYDLRASVERCPECGTVIEARSVAS